MFDLIVSEPKERKKSKQDVLSNEKAQKREEFNLTRIISTALNNTPSVKISVFKASDSMNELPNHHDKQSNSSSEEKFVPSDNDPIRETGSGDEECGLAKWYWACQHFASWKKNIF